MEYLDIYDYEGNPKGITVPRGYHGKDDWFLCIHAYIMTHDKQFLIQRRSLEKEYFPGIWDITTGAVLSGEEPIHAAVREVKEELGLDVSQFKNYCIGRSHCYDCLNIVYLFLGEVNVENLSLQKEEVMDAKLISKDDMLDLIDKSNFKDDKYYSMIFDFFSKMNL